MRDMLAPSHPQATNSEGKTHSDSSRLGATFTKEPAYGNRLGLLSKMYPLPRKDHIRIGDPVLSRDARIIEGRSRVVL